jgi:hypothetical protein
MGKKDLHIHSQDLNVPATSQKRTAKWDITDWVSGKHQYYKPILDKHIGKVYSLEDTDNLKVFLTPHRAGNCCTNVIQDHCCATMHPNNGLR